MTLFICNNTPICAVILMEVLKLMFLDVSISRSMICIQILITDVFPCLD
jgi:hypothetical protein